MKIQSIYSSPLGNMVMLSDGKHLLRISFNTSSIDVSVPFSDDDITKMTKEELDGYFSRRRTSFDIPLDIIGTPLQEEVWGILSEIPYGETMTYGEISSLIAERRETERMSAQAVGGAVGANPFALLIPCHRVLGKGGKLVGYAAGLERKKVLLDIEEIKYRN